MDTEQRTLCNALEAEMIGASALMEAEELLEHEGQDYFRGFLQGYAHCLKLSDKFDAIIANEELL